MRFKDVITDLRPISKYILIYTVFLWIYVYVGILIRGFYVFADAFRSSTTIIANTTVIVLSLTNNFEMIDLKAGFYDSYYDMAKNGILESALKVLLIEALTCIVLSLISLFAGMDIDVLLLLGYMLYYLVFSELYYLTVMLFKDHRKRNIVKVAASIIFFILNFICIATGFMLSIGAVILIPVILFFIKCQSGKDVV